MLTYAQAEKLLDTARDKARGKPIDNNTRIMARPDGYAIQLHATDVLLIRPDDSVTYDTGGWRTVTTKERMNNYGPAFIWSNRGEWRASVAGKEYGYAEGLTVRPDGSVTGAAPESAGAEEKALRKAAKKYAAEFTDALHSGEVPAPSGGDCWLCMMPGAGSEHILSHMAESYFVPRLLANALETFGASQAATQTAHALMQGKPEYCYSRDREGFLAKGIEKTIRRYVLRQLGLAA